MKTSEIFLRMARIVCTRNPLHVVYASCHEILKELMPAKNMFIALLEQEDSLVFPYYCDELWPENELKLYPKEGLTGYTIDCGRTVHLAKERAAIDQSMWIGPDAVDWVGVPLRDRNDSIFGALVVQTYTPGQSYSEHQLAWLELMATQLSLAFQLHFFDREKAIATIAAAVEETTDLEVLYETIYQVIKEIIPAARHRFFIAQVVENRDCFQIVFSNNPNKGKLPKEWPLASGATGYIYTTLKTSLVYDFKQKSERPPFLVNGSDASFWLGAPLFSRDKIIGVVVIQSSDNDLPITRDDETSLNSLCPHIAHAIQRTAFFERTLRL